MDNITLTIPSDWLEGETLSQDDLRQVLKLGLKLHQQKSVEDTTSKVIQALLRTGRVKHLSTPILDEIEATIDRQPPADLPGRPVSEILVAQRRGEL